MNYQNIAEVYAANDRIREKLNSIVENLSAEDAELRADAESWTIREIVEHISIVENGMARISAKLLSKAEASSGANDGKVKIGADFLRQAGEIRDRKLKAPEMVVPTGGQTLAESVTKLKENRQMLEDLRERFEKIETLDFTFPHPAFGDLNAHEWLALIGGHEARHIAQIEKILRQHKPA
jgi:transcriptional accessory protein Tex/SPT6